MPPVVFMFLFAFIKIPEDSNLRKEGFNMARRWRVQPFMARRHGGRSLMQFITLPSVSKQRVMNAFIQLAFSFSLQARF